ncbi:MAG: hypothetical protein IKR48_02545 [Kiritimatiellae bacterium]|nr:hypothetical protein [Kiritimatiellia bacterium]
MQNDAVWQFITALENAIESRIAGCRAPYYKVDGTIIGNGSQDFTKEHKAYSFSLHGVKAQLIDIPGIEGNEERFTSIIRNALKKCHLVCYVARESKGVETNTLERIKSYLGKSVEVMGILNIPENPKKVYKGSDYCGEMSRRIEGVAASAPNLEASLLSVIPKELYARSISVAALPGLCALAWRDGDSTFADHLDFADHESVSSSLKRLNNQQQSFLLHATQADLYRMSRLEELRDAIVESCRDTPMRIRRNAILRLLSAIEDAYLKPMPEKLAAFKRCREKTKVDTDNYIRRLEDDRYQMRRNMGYAAKNAVYDYLRTEMLEKIVYSHIERNTGIKTDRLNAELESQKERLSKGVKEAVCEALKKTQDDFKDRIQKSTESWADDMARYMAELSVNVPTFDAEAFDWKEAGNWALSIGGYAMSGAVLGSVIPGVGNVLGAFIGGLIGVIMKVVEFFMSDAKKISKAKVKAQEAFENTAWNIWDKVKTSVEEVSEALYTETGKLMERATAKKEAAKTTHEVISHFAREMRALSESIRSRLDRPPENGTVSTSPSTRERLE